MYQDGNELTDSGVEEEQAVKIPPAKIKVIIKYFLLVDFLFFS
jgi:hypothetical protein